MPRQQQGSLTLLATNHAAELQAPLDRPLARSNPVILTKEHTQIVLSATEPLQSLPSQVSNDPWSEECGPSTLVHRLGDLVLHPELTFILPNPTCRHTQGLSDLPCPLTLIEQELGSRLALQSHSLACPRHGVFACSDLTAHDPSCEFDFRSEIGMLQIHGEPILARCCCLRWARETPAPSTGMAVAMPLPLSYRWPAARRPTVTDIRTAGGHGVHRWKAGNVRYKPVLFFVRFA